MSNHHDPHHHDHDHPDILDNTNHDLKALQAVLTAGINPTDMVLNGVWRHFLDVELPLPLPVMEMTDDERRRYANDIITEMLTVLDALDTAFPRPRHTYEQIQAISASSLAANLNNLWRELAGVFGPLVNEAVQILPPEIKTFIESTVLEGLMSAFDMTEEEARDRVKNDPMLRLSLRRAGVDPDAVLEQDIDF